MIVHRLAQTPSTNDVARALAHDGAAHGTVVIADQQTAGRGRLGRSWVAPPGCAVLMSIVLREGLPVQRIGLVCLGAAVATAEACGPAWRLKWPNDVVGPDDRKLAGILAEAEWARGAPLFVVVGIGINVHACPPGVGATCLAELGPPPDRDVLALAVARGVLAGFPDVIAAWRARSATLGRRVRIGAIEGTAVDVLHDGALVVDAADGRHVVRTGDVSMVG